MQPHRNLRGGGGTLFTSLAGCVCLTMDISGGETPKPKPAELPDVQLQASDFLGLRRLQAREHLTASLTSKAWSQRSS